ncbi:MAG: SIS domain-containing protein, partial [Actinomycetota bacterium]
MCGIVALVSRPSRRPVPTTAEILTGLDRAVAAGPDAESAVAALDVVNQALKGVPGLVALDDDGLVRAITDRLRTVSETVDRLEAALESEATDPEALERQSARLIAWRDVLWAITRDRLGTARAVRDLAGENASWSTRRGYLTIHRSLAALDRLEVRGRDSAGIHLFVWNHGIDAADEDLRRAMAERSRDPLFQSGSIRSIDGVLSIVYKAAAEIGELGDNTRVLRAAVAADGLLRRALSHPDAQVSLVGHTRWASVGIISEPNAHPVNSERRLDDDEGCAPYVVAALNGDVDNHEDLRVAHGLSFPGPITTDAKVIPALVNLEARRCGDTVEAFRRAVATFEGSVAIGVMASDRPDRILLALRGSGQGLYVGLAEDLYLVSSEPYGLVEETPTYLRLDGEVAGSSDGQIVALDGEFAGELAGVRRLAYDGTELPVVTGDLSRAEVTTRDIDLGDAPHFLLKEISEAPTSFRKTLRGKIAEDASGLRAVLGTRALPPDIVSDLAAGRIRKVRVVGQGTAAVAGRSCAQLLDELCGGVLDVDALTATELSGFHLREDMSDTLVIAVSQSGTTTDTNRTVDLVRSRGGRVLAIVNRRSSDLCDKADGVLFTSDGRDVEMSVASTKAFYAQVAAGVLLACALSDAVAPGASRRRHELLTALKSVPEAMTTVLNRRAEIADVARRLAPSKRYWAVVGNGPNAIAANEVRIKLSELCYKSISCDVTEDKKHIDLSCEPLILVCAAGLSGSTADDVAKEVAIYRAHKATPVVVADASDSRYTGAAAVVGVPGVDSSLAFVLSAMVGHLFGYESARAIDDLARPLREAREVVEHAVVRHQSEQAVLDEVRTGLSGVWENFAEIVRSGSFDGQLEASTAVQLATMLRIVATDGGSADPVEAFQAETGKMGTPAALIDDLTVALTRAIEELTRPIDAIKHQAKTVTVGISRSDEDVMDRSLVRQVLAAGAGRDVLGYRHLKILADLDPAVLSVEGFTRYRIEGDPTQAAATISIVDRGGVSVGLPSRVESNAALVGTKRRVAMERDVLVARGRSDGRTVIFVPEIKGGHTVGITLLHVQFHDRLPSSVMRQVLQGYDRRYDR